VIDLLTIDDKELNTGMQLLKKAISKKGWTAEIPYFTSVHCFIDRGDGKKIHIYSTTPPTTSFADAFMANDKFATYALLKENGTKQPETVLVSENIQQEEINQAAILINKYGKVVVKPIDGGHGKGITTNIDSKEKLLKAIKHAKQYTRSKASIIVQQMLYGEQHDLRIAIVGGKFIAAINRLPARVTGDGEHSLLELIEIENNTFRGEPYRAKLAVIELDVARTFLGEKINNIPEKGKKIPVIGVANYGQGGELIDVTDDIPAWMIEDAENIASLSGLSVCGVDYLCSSLPNKDSTEHELDAYFIEINKCPSLAMHDRPTVGKNRHAVDAYVDYLDLL